MVPSFLVWQNAQQDEHVTVATPCGSHTLVAPPCVNNESTQINPGDDSDGNRKHRQTLATNNMVLFYGLKGNIHPGRIA